MSDNPYDRIVRASTESASPARSNHDDLIDFYSKKNGVDPELTRRVVGRESSGRPDAVSPKGASGLMQLMPDTARGLGVTDLFDPHQNLDAGTRYLKQQLDEFGSPELALAAYNAGPGKVRKYGKIPPYPETQNYVKTILKGYKSTSKPFDQAAAAYNTIVQQATEPLTKRQQAQAAMQKSTPPAPGPPPAQGKLPLTDIEQRLAQGDVVGAAAIARDRAAAREAGKPQPPAVEVPFVDPGVGEARPLDLETGGMTPAERTAYGKEQQKYSQIDTVSNMAYARLAQQRIDAARQRQAEARRKQARAAMQRGESAAQRPHPEGLLLPAGQQNDPAYQPRFGGGQPYREVPKVDLSIGNTAQLLAPAATTGLTFEQDRAARAAAKDAKRPLQGIGDLRRYEEREAKGEERIKSAIRAQVLKEESQRQSAAMSGTEAQLMAQRARQEGLNPPDIEARVEERYQAYLRSISPEMVEQRKVFGELSPAVRAVAAPVARSIGGLLKFGGGVAGVGGIAPNDISRWANARGAFVEESATLAPLNQQGEEIVRRLPEQAVAAVTDLGLSISQLVLMKKATGLPLGRLMALETVLKTSDTPLKDRAKQVAQSYAMGTVLDQHLGRLASAALFGAQPGLQNLAAYKEGQTTLEDALLQTGIQAGAGFILGGKGPKELPIKVAEAGARAEVTPEWLRTRLAKPGGVGQVILVEDLPSGSPGLALTKHGERQSGPNANVGRVLSVYGDPETKGIGGVELSGPEAVEAYAKRGVQIVKVSPAEYDQALARINAVNPTPPTEIAPPAPGQPQIAETSTRRPPQQRSVEEVRAVDTAREQREAEEARAAKPVAEPPLPEITKERALDAIDRANKANDGEAVRMLIATARERGATTEEIDGALRRPNTANATKLKSGKRRLEALHTANATKLKFDLKRRLEADGFTVKEEGTRLTATPPPDARPLTDEEDLQVVLKMFRKGADGVKVRAQGLDQLPESTERKAIEHLIASEGWTLQNNADGTIQILPPKNGGSQAVTPPTPETPRVEEKPGTLVAQFESMMEGRGNRKATILPANTPSAVTAATAPLPPGVDRVIGANGDVVVFKSSVIDKDKVKELLRNGRSNELTGMVNPESPKATVLAVARGVDGEEKWSGYIEPGLEDAFKKEAEAQFAPYGPLQFEFGGKQTEQKVLADRQTPSPAPDEEQEQTPQAASEPPQSATHPEVAKVAASTPEKPPEAAQPDLQPETTAPASTVGTQITEEGRQGAALHEKHTPRTSANARLADQGSRLRSKSAAVDKTGQKEPVALRGTDVKQSERRTVERRASSQPSETKEERRIGTRRAGQRRSPQRIPDADWLELSPEEREKIRSQLAAEMGPPTAEEGQSLTESQPLVTRKPPKHHDYVDFPPEMGGLAFPRAVMPQIDLAHRGAMTQYLKGRGLDWDSEEATPRSLKPSQAEYRPSKVEQSRLFSINNPDKEPRKILVSSDSYILDGHHQWLAKMEDAPDVPIPILRLHATAQIAIPELRAFGSSFTEGTHRSSSDIAQVLDAEPSVSERPSNRSSVYPQMGADLSQGVASPGHDLSDLNIPSQRRGVADLGPQVANRHAPALEGGLDTTGSDIQFLSNTANTQPFRDHGLRGLDVPSQREVMVHVLRAIHDLKIRKRVVQSVPVSVVDDLLRAKSASDVLLHDPAVLKDASTVKTEDTVSVLIDTADALIHVLAGSPAERLTALTDTGGPTEELSSAVEAGTVDSRHVASPLTESNVSGASDRKSGAPPILAEKGAPKDVHRPTDESRTTRGDAERQVEEKAAGKEEGQEATQVEGVSQQDEVKEADSAQTVSEDKRELHGSREIGGRSAEPGGRDLHQERKERKSVKPSEEPTQRQTKEAPLETVPVVDEIKPQLAEWATRLRKVITGLKGESPTGERRTALQQLLGEGRRLSEQPGAQDNPAFNEAVDGLAKALGVERPKAVEKPVEGKKSVDTTVAREDNAERERQSASRVEPEIRGPRPAAHPTTPGAATTIKIPGTSRAYAGHYSVREVDDLVPSHNPQSFQPNPDYFYVNDRHYDKEAQYKKQVIDRSKSTGPEAFDPSFVINNSPTAETGPPIVDQDGNVLGGNSRAMIIHRVYTADTEAAAAYRQQLNEQVGVYGLDAQALAEMKKPVLVRELDDEQLLANNASQQAITEFNVSSTTALTQEERAVSGAQQISADTADYIARKIERAGEDATLAQVMDAHGVDIINRLIDEGVFTGGERNSLLREGKATAEAKSRVEKMLVGRVYRDLAQMEATAPVIQRNIERIVAPALKVEGSDWDIAEPLKGAIDVLNEARGSGMADNLDEFQQQQSFVRPPYNDEEIALAKALQLGPRKTAEKFRAYANDYEMAAGGGGLFGAPVQSESFAQHFGNGKLAVDPVFSAAEITEVPPRYALKTPIKGRTGAEIIGYHWRSREGERYSEREGGIIPSRVSNWEDPGTSTGTGRQIVHEYYVKHPDSRITIEGVGSAQKILGINETRLQAIARKEREAQRIRNQQVEDHARSYEANAKDTAAEASRSFRQRNYSAMRSADQNDKIFDDSTLLERDGKFIRIVGPTNVAMMRERGWAEPKPPTSQLAVDPLFSTAFHGSPHTFDKFSTERIGTGEGAQAYGYGLYFTDKREVADYYREQLSQRFENKKPITYNGIEYPPGTMRYNQLQHVAVHGKQSAIEQLEDNIKFNKDYAPLMANLYRGELEFIKGVDASKLKAEQGKVYEVELAPKEDEYLLWDKPLSEQSEKVQGALVEAGYQITPNNYPSLKQAERLFRSDKVQALAHEDMGIRSSLKSGWQTVQDGDVQAFRRWFDGHGGLISPQRLNDETGERFYEKLKWSKEVVRDPGAEWKMNTGKDASEYLHSLGIRGIKYLDQGSRYSQYEARWSDEGKRAVVQKRGTSDPIKIFGTFAEADRWIEKNTSQSYNYVIFSDDDVEITAQFSDYRGVHQAPDAESGAPLHDLTQNGIYPDDVYGERGMDYRSGEDAMDHQAYSLILQMKGKPNAPVFVYRAVPKDIKGGISKGDWVTPIRAYAVQHGESNLDEYKIDKLNAHARDLFTDGNSWLEWGYDPQPLDVPALKASRLKRLTRNVERVRGGEKIIGINKYPNDPYYGKEQEFLTQAEKDLAESPPALVENPRGWETAESGPEEDPEFSIEGNHITLNNAARALMSDAYGLTRFKDRLPPNGIGGVYEKAPGALAEALDVLAAQQPERAEGAKALAAAVREVGKQGPVTLAYGEKQRRHEGVHRVSHEASGEAAVDQRHTAAGFKRLESHPAWPTIQSALLDKRYPASLPVLVDEAFAYLATGDNLGLSDEDADSWMETWLRSFKEKNGSPSIKRFKELSHGAEQARQRIYAEGETVDRSAGGSVPGVSDPGAEGTPGAHEEGAGREPWQQPRAVSGLTENEHRLVVAQAINTGKNVPATVLKEYPGLAESIHFEQTQMAETGNITQTPEFLSWFGDSKVVDKNGAPLVVYHRSPFKFTAFDKREIIHFGFHFGTLKQARAVNMGGARGHLYQGYLKIENPLRLPDLGSWDTDTIVEELRSRRLITDEQDSDLDHAFNPEQQLWEIIKSHGYDGIVYENLGEREFKDKKKDILADSYIVPEPTQFKSIKNRGTFDPDNPSMLFAEHDPWEHLRQLAEKIERPEGQKTRRLPQTFEAAEMETGTNLFYPPTTIPTGIETGKQTVAEKGIDGAIEFVKTGDGIGWASTGYEVLAQLRADEQRIRPTDAQAADAIADKRLKFLDEFVERSTELGRAIVGLKAIEMFAPDRAAYHFNKASKKGYRKRGITKEEEAEITRTALELQRVNDELKAAQASIDYRIEVARSLEEDLAAAEARARRREKYKPGEGKEQSPRKVQQYDTELKNRASTIKDELLARVGSLNFGNLKIESRFPGQEGKVGPIKPLPGDAELLAQYTASQLATHDTVADLNKHLIETFGPEVEPYLSSIRKRAFQIRKDARLAELANRETSEKRSRTILSEIQKEIATEAKAVKDMERAHVTAEKERKKAEKAATQDAERSVRRTERAEAKAGEKELREEARRQAKAAREQAREARLAEIKEARARLKETRKEYQQASEAESKGWRATSKAQREAARTAGLWDTPIRRAAEEARTRLATATDAKDPLVMEELAAVAAAKFLPDEPGGPVRKKAVFPSKVRLELIDEFPGLVTRKNVDEVYKRGYQRILDMEAAAREAARLREANKESQKLWEKMGVDTDAQALLIQRATKRRQQQELRHKMTEEFERVSRSRAASFFFELNAFPRSAKSSIDAPELRQGLWGFLTHPIAMFRTLTAAGKGYTAIHPSEYHALVEELQRMPRYELAKMAGMDLPEIIGDVTDPRVHGEEYFQSGWGQKVPHIRLSEQAYVLSMNTKRMTLFNLLAPAGEAHGYTWENNPEFFKQVASFINDVTGRGNVPESMARFMSTWLNWFFFAPRYNVSKVQLLNDLFNPLKYVSAEWAPETPGLKQLSSVVKELQGGLPGSGAYDPIMRKIAAEHIIRWFGALLALFMVAKLLGFGITFDPEDADAFPKVRWGNTSYDFSGGEIGTVRFLYRFLKGIAKLATGHHVSDFENPAEIAKQFLRQKLSPWAGGFVDWITGTDAVGQPSTIKTPVGWYKQGVVKTLKEDILVKMIEPIVVGDFLDGATDSGWLGVSKTMPALLGLGVQTYPRKEKPSSTEKLIHEKLAEQREQTPQEKERSQLMRKLEEDIRQGKPVTAQIEAAVKEGKLRPDDPTEIARSAQLTPAQLAFKQLGISAAMDVYADPSLPAEDKAALKELLINKGSTIENLPEPEQDAAEARFESLTGEKPKTRRQQRRESGRRRSPRWYESLKRSENASPSPTP